MPQLSRSHESWSLIHGDRTMGADPLDGKSSKLWRSVWARRQSGRLKAAVAFLYHEILPSRIAEISATPGLVSARQSSQGDAQRDLPALSRSQQTLFQRYPKIVETDGVEVQVVIKMESDRVVRPPQLARGDKQSDRTRTGPLPPRAFANESASARTGADRLDLAGRIQRHCARQVAQNHDFDETGATKRTHIRSAPAVCSCVFLGPSAVAVRLPRRKSHISARTSIGGRARQYTPASTRSADFVSTKGGQWRVRSWPGAAVSGRSLRCGDQRPGATTRIRSERR